MRLFGYWSSDAPPEKRAFLRAASIVMIAFIMRRIRHFPLLVRPPQLAASRTRVAYFGQHPGIG